MNNNGQTRQNPIVKLLLREFSELLRIIALVNLGLFVGDWLEILTINAKYLYDNEWGVIPSILIYAISILLRHISLSD